MCARRRTCRVIEHGWLFQVVEHSDAKIVPRGPAHFRAFVACDAHPHHLSLWASNCGDCGGRNRRLIHFVTDRAVRGYGQRTRELCTSGVAFINGDASGAFVSSRRCGETRHPKM